MRGTGQTVRDEGQRAASGVGGQREVVIPEPICCDVSEHIQRSSSLLSGRVTLNIRQPPPAGVMNLVAAYST